jgi:hypothetical protein
MDQSSTGRGQGDTGWRRLHRQRRFDALPPSTPLTTWAAVFASRPGPQLLALAAMAWFGHRLRLGRPHVADGVVAASVVAAHPFAEWLVHVRVLHRAPAPDGGETFPARMHRLHHEDPKDIDLALLPLRSVAVLVAGATLAGISARERRRGATGAAVALGSILAYEWVHFLIHSPYRPRHGWYRRRWRAHRLHHYRNEHWWFGVIGTSADRLLRTAPARGDVPVSPTAQSLRPSSTAPGPSAQACSTTGSGLSEARADTSSGAGMPPVTSATG